MSLDAENYFSYLQCTITMKTESCFLLFVKLLQNSIILWQFRVLGWKVSYRMEFTPEAEAKVYSRVKVITSMNKVPGYLLRAPSSLGLGSCGCSNCITRFGPTCQRCVFFTVCRGCWRAQRHMRYVTRSVPSSL
jgi:hypothetical protein